ncbi:hypothetical protein BGZ73_005248 [Actinomortierella ambigua]|nr:hypothetical protein BGZ73_005248 [Actinomortierella ambigua]
MDHPRHTLSSNQLSLPSQSDQIGGQGDVSLALPEHTVAQGILLSAQEGSTIDYQGTLRDTYVEQDNSDEGILSGLVFPRPIGPERKRITQGEQSFSTLTSPRTTHDVVPEAETVDGQSSIVRQQQQQREFPLSTSPQEATKKAALSRRATLASEYHRQQGEQYLIDSLTQIYCNTRSISNSGKASSQTGLSRSSTVTCTSHSSEARIPVSGNGKGASYSALRGLERRQKQSPLASYVRSLFATTTHSTTLILTSAGFVAPSYTLQTEQITGMVGDIAFVTPANEEQMSSPQQSAMSQENEADPGRRDQNHDNDKEAEQLPSPQ